MAGLQLAGLASGLDWRSLVDKLMEAERIPQNRLRAEKAAGERKTASLGSLKDNLTALQTSIKALSGETTDAAAQIVFCKSSGGQAEGEMDGSMLR